MIPQDKKMLIKLSTDKEFLNELMPEFRYIIDTARKNYKRLYLCDIPDIALIKAALLNYSINLQSIRQDEQL